MPLSLPPRNDGSGMFVMDPAIQSGMPCVSAFTPASQSAVNPSEMVLPGVPP